jgi:CheY-like chemotaxis protein
VLLAEDNPTNQFIAVRMLQQLGCRVEVAGNGVEAVDALRQTVYDLVLMDMMMPEMDGIAATRLIRAETGPNRSVPIIGVTANAFTQDREACLDVGMTGFLAKPITKARLREAMEEALSAEQRIA